MRRRLWPYRSSAGFAILTSIILASNTNSLSKIKFMEEGNHILFADIEDRLGRPAVDTGNPQFGLMRWSVPAARAAFRPILVV